MRSFVLRPDATLMFALSFVAGCAARQPAHTIPTAFPQSPSDASDVVSKVPTLARPLLKPGYEITKVSPGGNWQQVRNEKTGTLTGRTVDMFLGIRGPKADDCFVGRASVYQPYGPGQSLGALTVTEQFQSLSEASFPELMASGAPVGQLAYSWEPVTFPKEMSPPTNTVVRISCGAIAP